MNSVLQDTMTFMYKRPRVVVSYMAKVLNYDFHDVLNEIQKGIKFGWIKEYPRCCGLPSVYELSGEGRIVVEEASRAGQ